MRTVVGPSTFEAEPTKGSRFVASVAACSEPAGALGHVDACRERWPDATHHCWAFRLADGEGRSSDDGEPGGSAGRPILAQIDGHEVVDVVVVVVRWFGGTKLGVGGLVRAYGGCAGQALDRADLEVFVPMVELEVAFDHRHTGDVHHVIGTHGVEILDTTYGEGVTMRLRMAEEVSDAVRTELIDRTGGQAVVSGSPGA